MTKITRHSVYQWSNLTVGSGGKASTHSIPEENLENTAAFTQLSPRAHIFFRVFFNKKKNVPLC